MNEYAVALEIPGRAGREISTLRKRYARFMEYSIAPHITLAPLFTASEPSFIRQQLQTVAQGMTPFHLRLKGIRYFEGPNNVAYVSVEDIEPIFDLNRAISRALGRRVNPIPMKGLTVAGQPMLFDPKTFVPHATIAENIPRELLPAVRSDLAALQMNYLINIKSLSLFFAPKDRKPQFWRCAGVHVFKGTPK